MPYREQASVPVTPEPEPMDEGPSEEVCPLCDNDGWMEVYDDDLNVVSEKPCHCGVQGDEPTSEKCERCDGSGVISNRYFFDMHSSRNCHACKGTGRKR